MSKKWIFLIISLIIISLSIIYLNIDPFILFNDMHYVVELISEMFPPNFKIIWENSSIPKSIIQTLCMAYLGTLIGGCIALIFSLSASNNIFENKKISGFIKLFMSFIRVIPSLLIILIFVVAVGPGPFAGVLTIIVSTIGTLGKLFTESLENIDPTSSNSLKANGVPKILIFKYAIWPEFIPTFISNILYCFDLNTRAAIGLGIFGGGGIGYKLFMAMRVLHYKDAVALIICIILLILIIENLSNYLRNKILKK